MPNPAVLANAIAIAAIVHEKQFDKWGSTCVHHPIRMMMKAQTDAERIVAMLHDVVEDSDLTLEALRKEGFSDQILAGIDGMTKREGKSYEAFIDRAARNPLLARVKLLDY